jgi:Tol biopolymer transport system component
LSNIVTMTTDNSAKQPAWSTDGSKIIFVDQSDGLIYQEASSGVLNTTVIPDTDEAQNPIWVP